GFGRVTDGTTPLFTSRRRAWVSLVAGGTIRRACFNGNVLSHSSNAIRSAHGASSFCHTGAVSESLQQRCDMSRTCPFDISEKSFRTRLPRFAPQHHSRLTFR